MIVLLAMGSDLFGLLLSCAFEFWLLVNDYIGCCLCWFASCLLVVDLF